MDRGGFAPPSRPIDFSCRPKAGWGGGIMIETSNRVHNRLDHLRWHPWPKGKREDFGTRLLGLGQVTLLRPAVFERGLEMKRNRIMNAGGDSPTEQVVAKSVTPLGSEDIEVVY